MTYSHVQTSSPHFRAMAEPLCEPTGRPPTTTSPQIATRLSRANARAPMATGVGDIRTIKGQLMRAISRKTLLLSFGSAIALSAAAHAQEAPPAADGTAASDVVVIQGRRLSQAEEAI